MFKSSRSRGPFTSQVMVVQSNVFQNYARNAKIGFWFTAILVGLATVAIATGAQHPIVAVFFGAVAGFIAGVIVWTLIRAWLVLRFVWWWAAELIIALTLLAGVYQLGTVSNVYARIAIVAVTVGVPLAIGISRRFLVGWFFCFATRHRLRVLFTDVIRSNQSGSLPLILWAHPTPVGERVWVFLRPGLSKATLQTRLDLIASACWATSATVEQPRSNSAYLQIDVKRRDVLSKTIESPLVSAESRSVGTPGPVVIPPSRLDLKDVPLITKYVPNSNGGGKKPAASSTKDARGTNGHGSDLNDPDLDDWIN